MPEQKVSKVPKGAKRPTDHKPPADDDLYEFTWHDTTYRLPLATEGVDKVSGRQFRDAVMDGEEGQLRLGFAMLEAVVTDETALDALYSMPAPAMLEHVKAWMAKAREGEATVGESLGSLS